MKDLKPTSKRTYYPGLGRRKSAVARVRLHMGGTGKMTVNERPIEEYINIQHLRQETLLPLDLVGQLSAYDVTVKVVGGGYHAQTIAIQLGIARALLQADEGFRKVLRGNQLLTTDARVKERKKPGLVKARKAKQYTKR